MSTLCLKYWHTFDGVQMLSALRYHSEPCCILKLLSEQEAKHRKALLKRKVENVSDRKKGSVAARFIGLDETFHSLVLPTTSLKALYYTKYKIMTTSSQNLHLRKDAHNQGMFKNK